MPPLLRRRFVALSAIAAFVLAPLAGWQAAALAFPARTVAAASDPIATFTSDCQLFSDNSFTCSGQIPRPAPTSTSSPSPTSAPTTHPPTPTVAPTTSAPTPTSTPTTTSGPTPTPTPTVGPVEKPGPLNTGKPAWVATRPFTGTIASGAVLDGYTFGCISINVTNVVIRNSTITCRSGPFGAITGNRTGLKIEDTTISCGGTSLGAGATGQFYALRLNVSGCENGFSGRSNIRIESSWVHGLTCTAGTHTDAFQIDNDSFNIVVLGNTFEQNCPVKVNGVPTGTAAIIGDTGTHVNVTIEGNWLSGAGSYTVYCPLPGGATNYRLAFNQIGKSAYGHTVNCGGPGQTVVGNTYL